MTCSQCNKDFNESKQEEMLRQKISPEIGGQVFELPEPANCPLCREQNRISFRNERKLYARNCSICDKKIISVYSPDKDYRIACRDCFWSDKNNSTESTLDYDPNKSFFKQFDTLLHHAPLLSLFVKNMENSDYVNQEEDDKNCYQTVGGHFNENCYFSTYSINGYKNIDCYFVFKCENLYESMFCNNCTNSQFLDNCENCNNCYLCSSCVGCNDCFGSVNLQRKQYYYFNKPLSQDEYQKKISVIFGGQGLMEEIKREYNEFSIKQPRKFANISNSESSTGDYLTNCKNLAEGYSVEDTEDSAYQYLAGYVKDSLDTSSLGWAERVYNIASSTKLNGSICLTHCISCPDCYYSSNCQNSSNLFGCVGLNHKQYCILNKQYSKEEYEGMVTEIIKNMQQANEWGRFFPISISPFGYNETVAMDYFPLTRDAAKDNGWKWQDEDFGIKYDGPFYNPKVISQYDPQRNPEAQNEIDECLKGILKCEKTGRPFKIIPQELAEYVQKNIDIPRRHPDQRHFDRLSKISPMKLYHRKCMNDTCQNEFETTYASDRPEKVYCESCYQKSVI